LYTANQKQEKEWWQMTIYTVIAYKPNGTETSMGCRMGEYPSDMRWLSSTDEKDIIKFIEDREVDNMLAETQEPDYEYTYIYDGVVIFPGYERSEGLRNAVIARVLKIREELVKEHERLSLEREKINKAKEIALYNELKTKYEKTD
jgi:hypothetical protein